MHRVWCYNNLVNRKQLFLSCLVCAAELKSNVVAEPSVQLRSCRCMLMLVMNSWPSLQVQSHKPCISQEHPFNQSVQNYVAC